MVRRLGAPALSLGIVVLALLALPAAGAGSGATFRVSASTGGGAANGRSFFPAISSDGHFVAFYSDASNLVAGDTNGSRDVFVDDYQTGELTRVSVDSSGVEANDDSFAPAISADGRFVAFSSAASNLVAGDMNGADDVFVRDRQEGTTTRVSVAPGGAEANGGSFSPSISGDGRYVAFLSDATNLVAGDTNSVRDVFVFDRQTGTTMRASVDSAGVQADIDSATPVLSADGRFVAFSSFSDNLIPLDQNESSDVFVRNLLAGTTTRVSEYQGGFESDFDSLRPAISADGRFVAFDSDADNLAFGDVNDAFDVFVKDRQTDVLTQASVDDSGTQVSGDSIRPAVSADGRIVAFYSDASNLVPGDTNGSTDVFVHDRRSGATKRVSVAAGGVEANGDSVRPAISGDGRLVVFDSDASNLVAGDSNHFTDVFLNDPSATPPPPPAPPARCTVPRVIGLRLATARSRIRRAHCRVGRVRRARSRRVGRVLSQSPRAHALRPRGTKVNLVVGRR
ncbi:MAG TPA: PASTA domain-containing protein [Gaiellaceae bacterium]|nr:PASTA domain-containing protein [Gaiellaceae bacterium]